MKHLEPLMTHLSPRRTALVFMPDTSDPASGSVRQKDASNGASERRPRYSFLSSSEAASAIGAVARPLHEIECRSRAAPGDLLFDDRAVEVTETGTSVLGGEVAVHEAELPRLLDDLARPGAFLVVLPGDRANLLLGKVMRHLAHCSAALR